MRNTTHKFIPITKKGHSEQWIDAKQVYNRIRTHKGYAGWLKQIITMYPLCKDHMGSKKTRYRIDCKITLQFAFFILIRARLTSHSTMGLIGQINKKNLSVIVDKFLKEGGATW